MLLMCSLVFKLTKKRATSPNSLSHFKASEKEIQTGLNSLSCFKAHEKEVHWTSTRSLISKLVKKRSVRVLIRFLVFKLMKKRSTGPNSLSHFKAREKKTQPGLKKRSTRTSFLIFVYERHQSHYASAFDSCCYFTLVFS